MADDVTQDAGTESAPDNVANNNQPDPSAGTQNTDTGDKGTAAKGPDPVPYDRFQQVNAELKKAQTALKKLQDAEAERNKAAMSETERLKAEKEEALAKVAQAEEKARRTLIRAVISGAASKANFADPDDAFRFVDDGQLEFDDDGNLTNAGKVIADLAKAKPYLVKTEQAPNTNAQNGLGRGGNGPGEKAAYENSLRQRFRF